MHNGIQYKILVSKFMGREPTMNGGIWVVHALWAIGVANLPSSVIRGGTMPVFVYDAL